MGLLCAKGSKELYTKRGEKLAQILWFIHPKNEY